MLNYFNSLKSPENGLPLFLFRIIFGALMVYSLLRFIYKGWVETCYLSPTFHFKYYGFSWVKVLPEFWMYSLVIFSCILAFCVMLGLFYRFSIVAFFLSFTYLELIDKTWYLNHYYFISIVSLLLIFLPAHHGLSLDAIFFPKNKNSFVPKWTIETIKWQLAIVYFFAGLAKLKYDWLIEAQPLKIWLGARTNFPVIGEFFDQVWLCYFFAWFGMFYDLLIPFFLFNKKMRKYAYFFVITFHLMTWFLFNIGVFPWVMIFSTLIFFSAEEWKTFLPFLRINKNILYSNINSYLYKIEYLLIPYFVLQIILPIRHYFYEGNTLWTEEGYRFAWHVMLMEKNGSCEFIIRDKKTNKESTIFPSEYLTKAQEKQMSFQPDMIWEFSKFLENEFKKKGYSDLEISVNNLVSLNGRRSKALINSNFNLLDIQSVWGLNHIILREKK